MANRLDKLVKWSAREEWRDMFGEVYALHVGPACQEHGIEIAQLESVIGDFWTEVIFACAFEDFMTHERDGDESSIVDDYLKRRGWQESATDRRYMKALNEAVMSLYEVSDIVPGESFLARDLVRGSEPVRISERSATRSLRIWDKIAARVVEVSGKHVVSGGLLRFRPSVADDLLAELTREKKRLRREMKKSAKSEPDSEQIREELEAIDAGVTDLIYLIGAAPVFTYFWLEDVLASALGRNLPTLVNHDGDEILFHTIRFPLLPGARADDMRKRLGLVPAFEEDAEGRWVWFDQGLSGKKGKKRGHRPDRYTIDDDPIVLGHIELGSAGVTLTVNSKVRADEGMAIFNAVGRKLLGEPATEIQTIREMIASGTGPHDESEAAEPPVEVTRDLLDRHYRNTLDEPLPYFDGKTPRAAAKTAAGKRKVVAWLKELENQTATHSREDAFAAYDFTWMWQELRLLDLRR